MRPPATDPVPPEGLLLVHKPRGMTSHDVVDVVRRTLGVRRVGHAGTLDPMAEGLLVVLVGRATKSQHALQGHDKCYEARLRLGIQTDTGDATGQPVRTAPVPPLTRARVEEALAGCEGEVAQIPPAYSAVKIQGKPAYWWARRRRPVSLPSRTVRVTRLTLQDATADTITFDVACSAGTYVRTLGELIAERLGSVGHLERLVRVSVGPWRLEQALPLAWIRDADATLVRARLLSVPTCAASVSRQ